jgi:hypothetical protein
MNGYSGQWRRAGNRFQIEGEVGHGHTPALPPARKKLRAFLKDLKALKPFVNVSQPDALDDAWKAARASALAAAADYALAAGGFSPPAAKTFEAAQQDLQEFLEDMDQLSAVVNPNLPDLAAFTDAFTAARSQARRAAAAYVKRLPSPPSSQPELEAETGDCPYDGCAAIAGGAVLSSHADFASEAEAVAFLLKRAHLPANSRWTRGAFQAAQSCLSSTGRGYPVSAPINGRPTEIGIVEECVCCDEHGTPTRVYVAL